MSGERLIKGASGWAMVAVVPDRHHRRGLAFVSRVDDGTWLAVAALAGVLGIVPVCRGLFVNQPEPVAGGDPVRAVRGDGPGERVSMGQSPCPQRAGFASHPHLRLGCAQGQRCRRQPGGDRRRHQLAGGRHRPGSFRRRGLRELRECPDRGRHSPRGQRVSVRHVEESGPSLRANADDVTATLQSELQDRLDEAGVSIRDCRLRRLAYAPEIAGEMLRRQQAGAVIAARKLIVKGAVSMVQDALSSSPPRTSSSSTRSARRRWCRT